MLSGKPVTVVKFNSLADGYVVRSTTEIHSILLSALEADMPRWQGNPPQRERLVCRGELPHGYAHFSVAMWWPDAEDRFGRRGLVTVVSRLYPPEWRVRQSEYADSDATLRAVDRLTESLAELTTDLATRGSGWPLTSSILSSMIDAEIAIADVKLVQHNHPDGPSRIKKEHWRATAVIAACSCLAGVAGGMLFWSKGFQRSSTGQAIAARSLPARAASLPVRHSITDNNAAPAIRSLVPQPQVVIVDADDVNIRKGPDADADLIRRASRGEQFQVFSGPREWTEVELPSGEKGWISEKFLRPNSSFVIHPN
jgi:hypothetical protein